MATKRLLGELCAAAGDELSVRVRFRSAGGVDVAREIRDGTVADLVVLAAGAMAELDADGLVAPGTLVPLFVSDVVAAVPDPAEQVALGTVDDLRAALLHATAIAYSTGPSGTALTGLLEQWELLEDIASKLVRAPAGTPVGSLLAGGYADLGFQQRSEFVGVDGVRVLGPLPGDAAIRSVFSGAVLARSTDPRAAARVLEFFASPGVAERVTDSGMTPA